MKFKRYKRIASCLDPAVTDTFKKSAYNVNHQECVIIFDELCEGHSCLCQDLNLSENCNLTKIINPIIIEFFRPTGDSNEPAIGENRNPPISKAMII